MQTKRKGKESNTSLIHSTGRGRIKTKTKKKLMRRVSSPAPNRIRSSWLSTSCSRHDEPISFKLCPLLVNCACLSSAQLDGSRIRRFLQLGVMDWIKQQRQLNKTNFPFLTVASAVVANHRSCCSSSSSSSSPNSDPRENATGGELGKIEEDAAVEQNKTSASIASKYPDDENCYDDNGRSGNHETRSSREDSRVSRIIKPASTLSLIEQYTKPGAPRRHPLQLLSKVAPELLGKSLMQDVGDAPGDATPSSSWSLEEIQIVTADAARRLANATRNLADDDVDVGIRGKTAGELLSEIDTEAINKMSASWGESVVDPHSERVVASFVEEQQLFDELHQALFRCPRESQDGGAKEEEEEEADPGRNDAGVVMRWVEQWKSQRWGERQQQQQQQQPTDATVTTAATAMSSSSSLGPRHDSDVESAMINAMFADLEGEQKEDDEGQRQRSFVHSPVTNTTSSIFLKDAEEGNAALVSVSGHQQMAHRELSRLVILLQRHILLASLASRFDAAVEAFMLLLSIRDEVDMVYDAPPATSDAFFSSSSRRENGNSINSNNNNNSRSSTVQRRVNASMGMNSNDEMKRGKSRLTIDVPVLTWRNLRDVIESCAASRHHNSSNLEITHESKYETAETLIRLVLKKCFSHEWIDTATVNDKIEYLGSTTGGGDPSDREVAAALTASLVPSQVLGALAKCVSNASELKRFRELMAVECAPPPSSSSNNNENYNNNSVEVSESGRGSGDGGGGGALQHIPVSAELYNELISACSRCSDEPQQQQYALMFFRSITDNGLEPTPLTYAAMVASYAANGSCTEAFSMFHEAKSKCDPAAVAACPPLYNQLVESYCNAGKLFDAISTANVLIDVAAPLTRRGFHAAMMCCAVQGDLTQCRNFLNIMQGIPSRKYSNNGIDDGDGENEFSYSIAPTPTTVAISLASLCFIRSEMTWKEKLTVIGDMVRDAFELLPASAEEGDGKRGKQQQQQQKEGDSKIGQSRERVVLFCENEPFHCAVLMKVMESVVCPPLSHATASSSSSSHHSGWGEGPVPSGTQRHDTTGSDIVATTPPFETSGSESSVGVNPTTNELFLYRRHLQLAMRVCQTHTQLTLAALLRRAVGRHFLSTSVNDDEDGLMENDHNNRGVDRNLDIVASKQAAARRRRLQRSQELRRLGERILRKADTIFLPQQPTRMPKNAEVAALMPDVVANPFALFGGYQQSQQQQQRRENSINNNNNSEQAARRNRASRNRNESEYGQEDQAEADDDYYDNIDEDHDDDSAFFVSNALINLLQTILPHTTVFHLPFACLRTIVTQADALLAMKDHPLLFREMYFQNNLKSGLTTSSGRKLFLTSDPDQRNLSVRSRSNLQHKLKSGRSVSYSGLQDILLGEDGGNGSNNNSSSSSSDRNDGDDDYHSSSSSVTSGDGGGGDTDAYAPSSQSSSSSSFDNDLVATISYQEREMHLNRIADATLALAVFLDHHGERVHIGSAWDDADASRAAGALRLANADPIHRGAAGSCSLLFSELDCSALGSGSDRRASSRSASGRGYDMRRASEVARRYNRALGFSASRPNQAEATKILSSFLRALMADGKSNRLHPSAAAAVPASSSAEKKKSDNRQQQQQQQQQQEQNVFGLYFHSCVNLSLVTYDARLRHLLNARQHTTTASRSNNNRNESFGDALRAMQRLARDALSVSFTSQRRRPDIFASLSSSSMSSSSSPSSSLAFRNITGSAGQLSSLVSGRSRQDDMAGSRRARTPEKEKEKSFAVRVVDPTKLVL